MYVRGQVETDQSAKEGEGIIYTGYLGLVYPYSREPTTSIGTRYHLQSIHGCEEEEKKKEKEKEKEKERSLLVIETNIKNGFDPCPPHFYISIMCISLSIIRL